MLQVMMRQLLGLMAVLLATFAVLQFAPGGPVERELTYRSSGDGDQTNWCLSICRAANLPVCPPADQP